MPTAASLNGSYSVNAAERWIGSLQSKPPGCQFQASVISVLRNDGGGSF